MRFFSRIAGFLNILLGISGIVLEITPFLGLRVADGMGVAIAIISFSMALVMFSLEQERVERKEEGARRDKIAERVSIALTVHELDFYSMWARQVSTAQANVDVTHLGPTPPKVGAEKKYFGDLKKQYQSTRAEVRRVERLTREKLLWIEELVAKLRGLANFSLRLYPDGSRDEMPFALSISRVDHRFGWIVAMAEHESTKGYRDLLLTGTNAVELASDYFRRRLWENSIPVITRGVEQKGWREEANRLLAELEGSQP